MTTQRRALLTILLWIAALAALAAVALPALVVSGDLRAFMPRAETPEQRLLMEELGEGPAARLLLIGIEGAEPERLAELSQALAEQLADSDEFRQVGNGMSDPAAVTGELLPYRYLLSPTLDQAEFDTAYLRNALNTRLKDLASPAAGLLKPWVGRDPTLEALKLLERWQPAKEPERYADVWFSRDLRRALLFAETRAAGFDPQGQKQAILALRGAFAAVVEDSGATLLISGPGAFSLLMSEKTQGEASQLGAAATLGMLLLMALAYRSARALLLGALPLVSAALIGMAAVALAFGEVHGITLAFGFTLIGVAQDYPLHLLSHQHAGLSPAANARSLWPTLATGVASTCIAYLAFFASGVVGLAQLAVFTITGLATAALTTRFLLPSLLAPAPVDPATGRRLIWMAGQLDRLPHPRWLTPVLAGAGLVAILALPGPFWENNLAALTPLPAAALQTEQELRSELGAPDLRYLLVVGGDSADEVLVRSEALEPALDDFVERGVLDGFEPPSRYLPSAARQLARQARLPEAPALAAALSAATAGLPFRPGTFDAFLKDVEVARGLPPLTAAAAADTPFGLRLGSLLIQRDGRWTGLVSLIGVRDPAALQAFVADSSNPAQMLDLKHASESLVVAYRQRVLWALGLAALLLIGVVSVALRRWQRIVRVLTPMALSTLLILAVLHASGVSLTLFHLIALMLAAGLGLDYALFFEHAARDAGERLRTLHAVLVCSGSTLLVFALLACSSLPVLSAIGITVSIGVVLNFVLALLITRPAELGDAHVA